MSCLLDCHRACKLRMHFANGLTDSCLHPAQDMGDTSAEAKPLRRRAAMLLGQWAVKMPATERPAAYRSLITLMSEQDAAVQLAAVSSPSVLNYTTILSGLHDSHNPAPPVVWPHPPRY